jgi:hypothetical protein
MKKIHQFAAGLTLAAAAQLAQWAPQTHASALQIQEAARVAALCVPSSGLQKMLWDGEMQCGPWLSSSTLVAWGAWLWVLGVAGVMLHRRRRSHTPNTEWKSIHTYRDILKQANLKNAIKVAMTMLSNVLEKKFPFANFQWTYAPDEGSVEVNFDHQGSAIQIQIVDSSDGQKAPEYLLFRDGKWYQNDGSDHHWIQGGETKLDIHTLETALESISMPTMTRTPTSATGWVRSSAGSIPNPRWMTRDVARTLQIPTLTTAVPSWILGDRDGDVNPSLDMSFIDNGFAQMLYTDIVRILQEDDGVVVKNSLRTIVATLAWQTDGVRWYFMSLLRDRGLDGKKEILIAWVDAIIKENTWLGWSSRDSEVKMLDELRLVLSSPEEMLWVQTKVNQSEPANVPAIVSKIGLAGEFIDIGDTQGGVELLDEVNSILEKSPPLADEARENIRQALGRLDTTDQSISTVVALIRIKLLKLEVFPLEWAPKSWDQDAQNPDSSNLDAGILPTVWESDVLPPLHWATSEEHTWGDELLHAVWPTPAENMGVSSGSAPIDTAIRLDASSVGEQDEGQGNALTSAWSRPVDASKAVAHILTGAMTQDIPEDQRKVDSIDTAFLMRFEEQASSLREAINAYRAKYAYCEKILRDLKYDVYESFEYGQDTYMVIKNRDNTMNVRMNGKEAGLYKDTEAALIALKRKLTLEEERVSQK